jgi:hypothetical protein
VKHHCQQETSTSGEHHGSHTQRGFKHGKNIICNIKTLSEAPPTRNPSTSGWLPISLQLAAVTEPATRPSSQAHQFWFQYWSCISSCSVKFLCEKSDYLHNKKEIIWVGSHSIDLTICCRFQSGKKFTTSIDDACVLCHLRTHILI